MTRSGADLFTLRSEVNLTKVQSINLDCLTKLPDTKVVREASPLENRSFLIHGDIHTNGDVLDDTILADKEIQAAIDNQGEIAKTYKIVNTDRSVGARISGAIALKYGDRAFEGQITLNFEGTGGQSFGAFNHEGVSLILTGESNDYVGKGINGGEIVIKPYSGTTFDTSRNVIIGNTCLYGATGGYLYANGRAGERFAVRNSRATIVITKALEKSGEKLGEGFMNLLGRVIAKIFQYSPEIATALESGDAQVLNLDRAVLTQIPAEPIFTEFLDAAGLEQNAKFKDKFQALKTDSMINIIGKHINITQSGTGNTQTNKNTFNL